MRAAKTLDAQGSEKLARTVGVVGYGRMLDPSVLHSPHCPCPLQPTGRLVLMEAAGHVEAWSLALGSLDPGPYNAMLRDKGVLVLTYPDGTEYWRSGERTLAIINGSNSVVIHPCVTATTWYCETMWSLRSSLLRRTGREIFYKKAFFSKQTNYEVFHLKKHLVMELK